MSEDTGTLTDAMFRDQVWHRFQGHNEPATVEDIANLYRAMILMHENMLAMMEISLGKKKLSFASLDQIRERSSEMIDIIGEGLKALDAKVPGDE